MDSNERREHEKPVPDDYKKHLTDEQYLRLESMRLKGWDVKFIRRPLFQIPICVVEHPENHQFAVIEEDGTSYLIEEDGTYKHNLYIPMRDI